MRKSYKKYIDAEITVQLQDLQNLKQEYKLIQPVLYKCVKCNQDVRTVLVTAINSDCLCKGCKTKKTWLDKYGTENINALSSKKEKAKQTCLKRYGVENVAQTKWMREKSRQWTSSKEFSDKLKETWSNRAYEDRQKIIQKREETCIKKYGVRNPFCNSKKIQKKFKEKHNVINPGQLKKVKEKRKQTCFEKYGMYHAPSSKYIYDNQSFDSSWELALWIYAIEHNEEIERLPITLQYNYNGIEHTYYPDFKYKEQLIEIKGDFFKENSKWIHPFDSSLTPVMQAKQQCALENNVQIWYYKDIQFALDYVVQKYTKDYLQLFKKNLPFPYPQLPKNPNDYDLIRCFHKSIYEASKGNRPSPLQAWLDKNLIKKTAINRLKYIGKCRPSDIVQGFNVAKIAPKVSIFKPTLAETLIKKYLDNYKTIFDPFSGFSGRLLGTVRCNKTYIGQDLNEKHVQESQDIIEFKGLQNCKVVQQDILTDQSKTFLETCLFTCPPYSNKEYWTTDKSELTKSCDEWIDICLEKYECSEYLFVVDETEKYKDKIVEVIENKSHFGKNNEYVILVKK